MREAALLREHRMPLTKQLSEQAERERLEEDPTLPPGGNRSGEGAASILPHLSRSLRAKPSAEERSATPEKKSDKPN